VGLGNLTNNAQIKKNANSTNGYVPTWSSTEGDTLGAGYEVETTLLGAAGKLATAAAIKTAIDTVGAGVGSKILDPVASLTTCKALDTTSATNFPDKAIMLIESLGLYRLDRDSSSAGNDNTIITPTLGSGRWFKLTLDIESHNALDGKQGGAANEYYHISSAINDALAGSDGSPSGSNKFVTSSDDRIGNLSSTGTFPVNQLDILEAEWTAFDNALAA
jgi:hypothetical protein